MLTLFGRMCYPAQIYWPDNCLGRLVLAVNKVLQKINSPFWQLTHLVSLTKGLIVVAAAVKVARHVTDVLRTVSSELYCSTSEYLCDCAVRSEFTGND